MLWRLALQCGKEHPKYLRPLSPQDLAEAQAFYRLEPWGPERDSWHAALIAMSCIQPWSKQRLQMRDFVLTFVPKEKPKSLREKVRAVAMSIGAKFKTKN